MIWIFFVDLSQREKLFETWLKNRNLLRKLRNLQFQFLEFYDMMFNCLFWLKSFPLIKNGCKERKKKPVFFFFLWFLWINHAKKNAPNQADNITIFQPCLLPKLRLSVVLEGRYTGYKPPFFPFLLYFEKNLPVKKSFVFQSFPFSDDGSKQVSSCSWASHPY